MARNQTSPKSSQNGQVRGSDLLVEEARPDGSGKRKRLTVDLPVDDADLLGKAAANAGYNRTTMIVRAIRLLSDVDNLVRAGGHVQFVSADGSRETLRIL